MILPISDTQDDVACAALARGAGIQSEIMRGGPLGRRVALAEAAGQVWVIGGREADAGQVAVRGGEVIGAKRTRSLVSRAREISPRAVRSRR